MEHELECRTCGATFEPGSYALGCPDCRGRGDLGRLEVTYDSGSIPEGELPFDEPGEPASMWDYRALLPLVPDDPVTLGEGGTPLVELAAPSAEHGVRALVKNETTNPTWSFKDRLNSLLLSNAVALGETRIATSSTGNHGASTAAYARRAGADEVIVLVPHATEPPCRLQIRAYGAEAIVTDYAGRGPLLSALVERGWYPTVNVTESHTGLPYGYEGYKTIAFELVDQLGGAPDAVCTAVGAGDGLYGIWKGFRELRDLGVIDATPRMVGVEPAERGPLAHAVGALAELPDDDEEDILTTSTMSFAVGEHAVEAVEESGGTAVTIEREAVETALRTAGREGIYLEPASALPVAAVDELVADGVVGRGESVVCVGTGAGVKWPEHTEGALGAVPVIEPTLEALEAAVPFALD